MELKKVETKMVDTYEIAGFEVKEIRCSESGSRRIELSYSKDKYIPDIYTITTDEGNLIGFEIQTNSFGILSAEETKKVVAGLTTAIEVVEILTKEFVR